MEFHVSICEANILIGGEDSESFNPRITVEIYGTDFQHTSRILEETSKQNFGEHFSFPITDKESQIIIISLFNRSDSEEIENLIGEIVFETKNIDVGSNIDDWFEFSKPRDSNLDLDAPNIGKLHLNMLLRDEMNSDIKSDVRSDIKSDVGSDSKSDVGSDTKSVVRSDTKFDVRSDIKSEAKSPESMVPKKSKTEGKTTKNAKKDLFASDSDSSDICKEKGLTNREHKSKFLFDNNEDDDIQIVYDPLSCFRKSKIHMFYNDDGTRFSRKRVPHYKHKFLKGINDSDTFNMAITSDNTGSKSCTSSERTLLKDISETKMEFPEPKKKYLDGDTSSEDEIQLDDDVLFHNPIQPKVNTNDSPMSKNPHILALLEQHLGYTSKQQKLQPIKNRTEGKNSKPDQTNIASTKGKSVKKKIYTGVRRPGVVLAQPDPNTPLERKYIDMEESDVVPMMPDEEEPLNVPRKSYRDDPETKKKRATQKGL